MRSVEEIVHSWKIECGLIKEGRGGSYRVIPYEGRRNLLNNLAQTLKDEGYSEIQIKDSSTQMLVLRYILPPPEVKVKNFALQKKITSDQWKDATFEVFHGKSSTFIPKENKSAAKAIPERKKSYDWSKAEVVPKDNIVVDTSGYAEPQYDIEFMKELGMPIPGEDNE